MNVPDIVRSTLDGEEISARVSLGGEDELFITPSRTLIYRAEGLLSDESIDEFPHEADRVTLSEGRRKTRFTLEYPIEGTREFTVPSSRTDAVLGPVLAGVLSGNGVTDPGETVARTYRFSELTLIVTSDRLVKHVGEAVWDGDFEGYHFDDVTGLSFEDGSVATQIVLEVDGRQQRIKAPNDEVRDVRERLERSLFEYHGVSSLEELNDRLAPDDEPARTDDPAVAFGDGVDPLGAESTEPSGSDADGRPDEDTGGRTDDPLAPGVDDAAAEGGSTKAVVEETDSAGDATADDPGSGDGFEGSGFEPATPNVDPELLERLETLEATVDRQNELLESQQETIEQLIEELRRGR